MGTRSRVVRLKNPSWRRSYNCGLNHSIVLDKLTTLLVFIGLNFSMCGSLKMGKRKRERERERERERSRHTGRPVHTEAEPGLPTSSSR